MAKVDSHAEKKGSRTFLFGWALIVFNLFAVLTSIYLPIDLFARTKQWDLPWADYTFFFLDTNVNVAFLYVVILSSITVASFLVTMFARSVSLRMRFDVPQTVSAEAALNVARYTAYIALFFGFLATIRAIQVYSQWRTQFEYTN